MPSQEVAFLRQRALLFAGPMGYNRAGKPVVAQIPVEVPCRWNFRRTEGLDSHGNTVTFDAAAVVSQRVNVGSLMWPGSLDDYNGTGSGMANMIVSDEEKYEVKGEATTFDIKGRARFRTLGLMRFKQGTT